MLDIQKKACYTQKRKVNFTFSKKGGGAVENRIAQLRRERGLSQAELAEAVGVTRQTVISLESGRYNASLLLAHKLAWYFGMAIEEIFIFEEEA